MTKAEKLVAVAVVAWLVLRHKFTPLPSRPSGDEWARATPEEKRDWLIRFTKSDPISTPLVSQLTAAGMGWEAVVEALTSQGFIL